jgi:hypothetical protein
MVAPSPIPWRRRASSATSAAERPPTNLHASWRASSESKRPETPWCPWNPLRSCSSRRTSHTSRLRLRTRAWWSAEDRYPQALPPSNPRGNSLWNASVRVMASRRETANAVSSGVHRSPPFGASRWRLVPTALAMASSSPMGTETSATGICRLLAPRCFLVPIAGVLEADPSRTCLRRSPALLQISGPILRDAPSGSRGCIESGEVGPRHTASVPPGRRTPKP